MSRRKRARREAAVGAVIGAVWGVAVWHWFGETPGELIAWVVTLGVVFALLLHHGEWMCG